MLAGSHSRAVRRCRTTVSEADQHHHDASPRVSLVVVVEQEGWMSFRPVLVPVSHVLAGRRRMAKGSRRHTHTTASGSESPYQAPQRVRAHGEGRQSGLPSPSPPTCGSGMAPPHHCCCCGCQPLAGMTLGQGGGCWGCGRIGGGGAGCGKQARQGTTQLLSTRPHPSVTHSMPYTLDMVPLSPSRPLPGRSRGPGARSQPPCPPPPRGTSARPARQQPS